MVNKQKVLIVDDDENIAELISLYLTKECFETMIVYDGESVMGAMGSFEPNLILLDLMLPGMDGYQVCREVRAKHATPIIMLSAKGEVFDKVLGLELGADDYMEKPFDTKELVARVKAVLRRYKPAAEPKPQSRDESVEYADLTINRTNYSVTYKGKNVDMPPRNWNSYIFWLLPQIMYLPGNSYWIKYGVMSTWEIPARWMCISSVYEKKLRITRIGKSVPSGVSVTSLK